MDSGNSGSLQSSSGGGDEEFDSRTESISSFLNPSTHFASLTNPNLSPLLQPPPPPPSSSSSHHHHPPATTTNAFFDHSSSSFSHASNPNPNPNPLYNLDSVWSRNLRSDPNFTDFASTENQNQTLMGSQQGMYPNPTPVDANTKVGRGPDHHQIGVTTKNPKKRTRASRRAPTTVLTTDTSNFRQMVQEFTGIPAAPFSTSSSPFSRRLDLFGGGGGGGLGTLYPLRPSAQKIQLQTPSFLNSATNIVESGTSNSLTTATTSTVEANSSSRNYQLPPSDIHGFSKQPQNLLNLQNPVFSFQSLLQTTLPQQSNAPVLGTGKSDNQQTNLLSGFPSSSSSSSRWRGQDENLGSFGGGNGNNENVSGYKLNSSDFHHQTDKGLENVVVSSRSGGDQVQGNVDSWICPSD